MTGWLKGAEVGDKFRWTHDGAVCLITGIDGFNIEFSYLTGSRKGECCWTSLPQKVEILTVLDELADI